MKKVSQRRISPGGRYRINLKYAPEVLFPSEALGRDYYEQARPDTDDLFITTDGKVCRPTYIATWGEVKEEVMDDVCQRLWGCKFSVMRSMWFDRLSVRYGLRTWNLVKLDIVDELG